MKLKLAKENYTDVEPEFSCAPSYCSACKKEIVWVKTKNGKRMPVEFIDDHSDKVISHFATCPQAQKFRKK